MSTAVVLGGGVSGLASAHYIQRFLPQFKKVIVLEGSSRLGGWVHSTTHEDGSIFEHGPRSIRPNNEQGRNTLTLTDELGLASDMLPVYKSDPSTKNRYLYVDGKLSALPNSFLSLFKTLPPFSKPLIGNLAKEPFRGKSHELDESIHSYVSRRLGKEVADLAISAMCRGIFAGDCKRLSVQACFPYLHEMETKHGSLIRGMLLGGIKSWSSDKPSLHGLCKRAHDEKWASWSLRHGMQQLTDTLAEAVANHPGAEVRVNSPCTRLTPRGAQVMVETDSDSILADLVISSIYSKDLASTLPEEMKDIKQDLSKLDSVNVVVVNLEYKDKVLPVSGFGHLLPSCESADVLGVVYDSCTFPEHNRNASPNSTRLTVMMGGAWYNRMLDHHYQPPSGEELAWKATEACAKQLGIRQQPIRSQVMLQKECIPQYRVGHVGWVTSVEDKVKATGMPLHLVGSSYKGPAINDCINNARKCVMGMVPAS